MPYILDPHGPGSRLSVMRDPNTRATRDQKRNEGSFFTPADVAEFMVETVIGGLKIGNDVTALDPACGTSVFLRAALAALRERQPAKDPAVIAENLFGIDIDRWAVHASAYVLLHDLRGGTHSRDSRPYATWQRLRKNLHVGDALEFDPPTCRQKDSNPLSRIFPTLESGPNVIVGNPPYARLGDSADLLRLARRYQTLRPASSTAEIHPLFVEQTIRLAAPNAAAALVLPLSIGFNTRPQFVATRRLIERTAGTWQFSFFDREPHALFGEDVKTRNTILTWTRGQNLKENAVMTAPLLKWRGNSRARMFRSIRHTRINHSITGGIPKVGGAIEANALDALWRRNAILGVCVSDIRSCPLKGVFDADDASVLVASTAYNFINAYLRPPKAFKGIGTLSDNKIHQLQFLRPDDAYAAYALLSSRTAFWLWHVLGDGFHVTRTNIENIPLGMSLFGPDECGRLAKLGQAMWQEAKISPLVSNNRSRFSLAFPNSETSLRREVDTLIAVAADLPSGFSDALDSIVNSVIAAEPLGRFHASISEDVAA